MQYLRVGHVTQQEAGTGASVFLFDRPAVGSYLLCGSAPATHELHALEVDATVPHIDGLALLGGSAFGLNAVAGVMQWCNERQRGLKVPHGVVPIIPAAAIYDLAYLQPIAPTPDDAYLACDAATENNTQQGRIGAGTGATVGKMIASAKPMAGGLGRAEIMLLNGVSVIAYAVVNSMGDIRHSAGQIIAGAKYANGEFANLEQHLLSGQDELIVSECNTTLVAIFTNAAFSKIELKRIAKVASAGMARAISPVFTRYDGDIVFCISLGDHIASENVVGAMAAEAVREAIVNAVINSTVV